MSNRKLPFETDLIKELVQTYDTPLQLYDEQAIKSNAINFMKTFKTVLPGFQQFFAVKALPNPSVLKLLTGPEIGMGLDCSSAAELELAKMLSIPGNKIMYTSNYTSVDDLKLALDMDVIINLDDHTLVHRLWCIYSKLPTKLFFRFNPGIGRTDSETPSNILGGPDAKFGMDEHCIIKGILLARNLGVEEFGIHVMTGSNVNEINYWSELIDKTFQLLNQLKELNIEIKYLNLGGGIGICYHTGKLPDIQLLASNIKNKIIENCCKFNLIVPDIYMENGRYITGPYGYLLSKCHVIKNLYGKTFYGLDASMSNLMRPGMYESYHHISILDKDMDLDSKSKLKPANVVGTLCENNDWFAKNRMLPEAETDDIFIIWDTGAHSHSMGFQYNGKLRAPEILVNGSEYKLIRRRETFEDYIQTVIL